MTRLLVLAILPLLLVAFMPSIHKEAYSTSRQIPNTAQIAQSPLQPVLSLSIINSPIARGNTQTVMVEVSDPHSGLGIAGVNIKGTVTYASLLPIYEFNGKTDGNGNFSYSWYIDKDVEPGTFLVVVSATSEKNSLRLVESTSFEAVQKLS